MRFRAALLAAACAAAASVAPAARAEYAPVGLGRRIVEAAVIATGRIESLGKDDYVLRVERWIAGEPAADTLRIRRFANWTCAERDHPYAVGERLLVFLERDRERGLGTIGAGCEGEAFLRDGRAFVGWAPHHSWNEGVPETDLLDAVAAYRAMHVKVGAEGWVEAWSRLLSHRSPLEVSTAVDHFSWGSGWGPRDGAPGTSLVGPLLAILEEGSPEDRAEIARHPGHFLGDETARALLPHLEGLAAHGPPGAKVAAALACAGAEPGVADRHGALLDALADPGLPLEDRRACAHMAGWYSWTPLPGVPLEAIAPAAARALTAIEDPVLLRDVMRYLGETWRGEVAENFENPLPMRARWLERLGFPAGKKVPPAAVPHPFQDPYLSAAERDVTVPAAVERHERPAVVFVVRALRRARNAEKSGDMATARRESGLALGCLFGAVEAAAKALGADPEEARARLR
jgi:hypothetical protein